MFLVTGERANELRSGDTAIIGADVGKISGDTIFRIYLVIETPDGRYLSVLPNNYLTRGIWPYVSNIQGLPDGFRGELFSIRIYESTPVGIYRIYLALIPQGLPPKLEHALASSVKEVTIKQ